jgi:glycosyltransferase involved in cell wall biosynthesis
MAAPRVSVIIPTRDRAELIAGAVRSALGQEGASVEVCVVDDGSEPPAVLPADLAERVMLVRLESPRGAGAARNAALAATSGELVAFLDDDDVWLPGKLARQLQALEDDAIAVACGFDLWDGAKLVASSLPRVPFDARELLAHPCLWPSTVLARRSALEAAGGFDETLARVHDWALWLRLADLGEVAIVPEVLVDRRWAPLPLDTAHATRAMIASRIEERLARLPASEARRLRARRWVDDGIVLARLGRQSDAARLLLRAWAEWPRSPLALRGLARVAAGERAWTAVAGATQPLRRRLRRRPPRPAGPAPLWDDP